MELGYSLISKITLDDKITLGDKHEKNFMNNCDFLFVSEKKLLDTSKKNFWLFLKIFSCLASKIIDDRN